MKFFKKTILKSSILIALITTILPIIPVNIALVYAQDTENTIIAAPQAPITGYRYKTDNGKLYKRLYNYSIGSWIGDWILVS